MFWVLPSAINENFGNIMISSSADALKYAAKFHAIHAKLMRAGNVRFFLKSQLPDAVSVLSHSTETPIEGKIYRRKIKPKGNGSVNLY